MVDINITPFSEVDITTCSKIICNYCMYLLLAVRDAYYATLLTSRFVIRNYEKQYCLKINSTNYHHVETYLFQPRCKWWLVIWNVCICSLHILTLSNEVQIPYMTGANVMSPLGLVIWTCVLFYLYWRGVVK